MKGERSMRIPSAVLKTFDCRPLSISTAPLSSIEARCLAGASAPTIGNFLMRIGGTPTAITSSVSVGFWRPNRMLSMLVSIICRDEGKSSTSESSRNAVAMSIWGLCHASRIVLSRPRWSFACDERSLAVAPSCEAHDTLSRACDARCKII